MSFVPKVSLDLEAGRGHMNTGSSSSDEEVILTSHPAWVLVADHVLDTHVQ